MCCGLWVSNTLLNVSTGRETGLPWSIGHLVTEVPGNQRVFNVSISGPRIRSKAVSLRLLNTTGTVSQILVMMVRAETFSFFSWQVVMA